jgi:hypothetical protein
MGGSIVYPFSLVFEIILNCLCSTLFIALQIRAAIMHTDQNLSFSILKRGVLFLNISSFYEGDLIPERFWL